MYKRSKYIVPQRIYTCSKEVHENAEYHVLLGNYRLKQGGINIHSLGRPVS